MHFEEPNIWSPPIYLAEVAITILLFGFVKGCFSFACDYAILTFFVGLIITLLGTGWYLYSKVSIVKSLLILLFAALGIITSWAGVGLAFLAVAALLHKMWKEEDFNYMEMNIAQKFILQSGYMMTSISFILMTYVYIWPRVQPLIF